MSADSLLPEMLGIGVSRVLMEFVRSGGPFDWDWDFARDTVDDLCEHGDLLLYRGKKQGEAARMFSRTARTVAVMACAPGGISLFGKHWEVDPEWLRLQHWLGARREDESPGVS